MKKHVQGRIWEQTSQVKMQKCEQIPKRRCTPSKWRCRQPSGKGCAFPIEMLRCVHTLTVKILTVSSAELVLYGFPQAPLLEASWQIKSVARMFLRGRIGNFGLMNVLSLVFVSIIELTSLRVSSLFLGLEYCFSIGSYKSNVCLWAALFRRQ